MSDFDLSGQAITFADADSVGAFGVERDIGVGLHHEEIGSTHPDARDVIRRHLQQEKATARRKALLRLNEDSSLDIERYTLGVSATQIIPPQTPFLHFPVDLSGSQQPDVPFRVQRVTANAPCPGFVLLSSLKLGNVGAIVGGQLDAWQVNATAWEEELDLPTLSPENAISFVGRFTGLVVTPFNTHNFQFSIAGSGPARKVPFGEDLSPSEPI
jgi:hypothetical protein